MNIRINELQIWQTDFLHRIGIQFICNIINEEHTFSFFIKLNTLHISKCANLTKQNVSVIKNYEINGSSVYYTLRCLDQYLSPKGYDLNRLNCKFLYELCSIITYGKIIPL